VLTTTFTEILAALANTAFCRRGQRWQGDEEGGRNCGPRKNKHIVMVRFTSQVHKNV